MKKQRRGRSLELLVSHLEKALGVEGVAMVESPKYLPDKITGKMREHDVVLIFRHAHHQATVAIECRDRSRPVGTPQVEAFHTKCKHTGVGQGIIVSSRGFYRPAVEKAQHFGIRCLDIEDVASHDWLLAPGLRLSQRRPIHLASVVGSSEALEEDGDYIIATDEGDEISAESLRSVLLEAAKRLPWDSRKGQDQVSEFKVEARDLWALNKKTGNRAPIDFVHCRISFEVIERLVPFRLVHYRDHVSAEGITEAAVAEVNAGKTAGRVVVVYKPGEGGNVVFIGAEREKEDKPIEGGGVVFVEAEPEMEDERA